MRGQKGKIVTEEAFCQSIEKILGGDKSGLKDIYDAYLSYIYQIVYGVVVSKEDAEDITSEFFIKFWQQADKYKAGSGHKGYLATIARNMAIDHLRKHKREVLQSFTKEDDEDTGYIEPVSDTSVEEEVISDMSLKDALDTLKPEERMVVDMKVLSQMTFAEISEATGAPMGTVTWRYREAIKKLRRCGYYEES